MTNELRQRILADDAHAAGPASNAENSTPNETAKPPKKSSWLKRTLIILAGLWVFGTLSNSENSKKDPLFKCISEWNGSMYAFADEVKDSLRDPDSFEHIQSYASPVEADGTQRIRMKYRARNGFGGMNIEMAEAQVTNPDCKIISWSNL